MLNVSTLASFSGSGGYTTTPAIQASSGGQILAPDLTTLSGLTLTIDGTGSFPTSQITSFTNSTLNLERRHAQFRRLVQSEWFQRDRQRRSSLTLPALTSYIGLPANYVTTTLEATGAGSILNLPNLTTLSSYSSNNDGVAVNALAGVMSRCRA